MDITNSASPGSGGLYRPSRKLGRPTPSRFDLKDAEKNQLTDNLEKLAEERAARARARKERDQE